MRNIQELLRVRFANESKGVYRPFEYEESQLLHAHYMKEIKLPFGKTPLPIRNSCGTHIANSYERIVVGDYGAYVEILPSEMVRNNIIVRPSEKYRMTDKYKDSVKYFWLETPDYNNTKIYFQRKTVAYADYKPDMCYVSALEVDLEAVGYTSEFD